MKLTVVTGNPNKAKEVAAFFSGSVEVTHIRLDLPEHRDDDVAKIAAGKAEYAYRQLKTPLIVDDTAFAIRALKGFPGPYAAYVLDTLGNDGILKLMDGAKDRSAGFTTAIAYSDGRRERVFTGTLSGTITTAPRGSNGFGYDPIFALPDGRTLAELPLEEKSVISHRARALSAFRDWFLAVQGNGNANG
jgi:XTP/dITP diphosphohydrolase